MAPDLFWPATGPEHRGRGGGREPRGNGEGGGGAAIPGGSVLGQICDDLLELQEDAGQVRDAARHEAVKIYKSTGYGTMVLTAPRVRCYCTRTSVSMMLRVESSTLDSGFK